MKATTFKRLTLVSAVALSLGAATAQAATGGNITNTRHNLGIGGVGVTTTVSASGVIRNIGTNTNMGDIFTTGTDQICVFCHTPHGAVANPPAPLWNKGATGSTYKAYVMGGNMATTTDAPAVGGMSLACLTCHDGTQAMDNMMNAPGSGGWGGASGARAQAGNNGDGSLQAPGAYVWNNTNGTLLDGGSTKLTSDLCINDMNCATGALKAMPQMLDTDLSNDHPIGMVYGGGLSASGVPTNPEFRPIKATSYGGGTNNRFYVDDSTGPSPQATATWGNNANFKLYPATAGNITTAKVECGTCHDPHIDQNPLFLRKKNSGSAVCLSCHIK